MSEVWVVMFGEDSQGGWVVGVTRTGEAGKALADEHARRPLEWRQTPTHGLTDGATAEWTARRGGCDWAEVTRYPMTNA